MIINQEEIKDLIPHRAPFLLIQGAAKIMIREKFPNVLTNR